MNKIEINIPEGFEIDNEKSNFSKGIIEFKPVEKKELSYMIIAKELFYNKDVYYTDGFGRINKTKVIDTVLNINNATSKEQLECLMAYNKLRNVAEYLNGGRKMLWENQFMEKYYIFYNWFLKRIKVDSVSNTQRSEVFFASKILAEQAIEILGEEEIKKALFIY